jgi:hypothetical protein
MSTLTDSHRSPARRLLQALTALLVGFGLVFTSSAVAHAAEKVEMPKLVGMPASDAREELLDLGLQVKLKAAPKGTVVKASNWVVAKQSVKPGKKAKVGKKIILTVKKKPKASASPTPTPTADPKLTTAGLDDVTSLVTCNRYGEAQFPYGWKGHTILGVIAAENQGDRYFVKFEADVTNAFNVKASAVAECTVGGWKDAPQVLEFNVY